MSCWSSCPARFACAPGAGIWRPPAASRCWPCPGRGDASLLRLRSAVRWLPLLCRRRDRAAGIGIPRCFCPRLTAALEPTACPTPAPARWPRSPLAVFPAQPSCWPCPTPRWRWNICKPCRTAIVRRAHSRAEGCGYHDSVAFPALSSATGVRAALAQWAALRPPRWPPFLARKKTLRAARRTRRLSIAEDALTQALLYRLRTTDRPPRLRALVRHG